MSESSEAAIAQSPQLSQSSPLLHQMDRRRTEPVGVVSLERFQAHYAQVPGWIVQRSALLSQLHTRYSSHTDAAGQGQDLVFASSQPVSPSTVLEPRSPSFAPPTLPTVSSSAPSSPTVSSSSASPSSASPSAALPSTPSTFRISRKPASLPSSTANSQTALTARSSSYPWVPSNPDSSQSITQANLTHTPSDSSNNQRYEPTGHALASISPQGAGNELKEIQPQNLLLSDPQTPPLSDKLSPSSPQTALPIAKETSSIPPVSPQSAQSLILPKRVNPSVLGSDLKRADSLPPIRPSTIPSDSSRTIFQANGDSHKSQTDKSVSDRADSAPVHSITPVLPTNPFDMALVLRKAQSNETTPKPTPNQSSSSATASTRSITPTAPDSSSVANSAIANPPVVKEKVSISQRLQRSFQALIFPKRINQPAANPDTGASKSLSQADPATHSSQPFGTSIQAKTDPDAPSSGNRRSLVNPASNPVSTGEIADVSSITSSDAPLVLRKVQPDAATAANQRSQDSAAESSTMPVYPTAPEIPVTAMPSERQTLIWRKGAETSPAHAAPLTIQQAPSAIARQPAAGQSAIAASDLETTSTATTGATQTPMQTPNVAQIAEQVSRMLHRQLTVERERRGMNLW